MNFKMKTSLLIFFIAKDLVSIKAFDDESSKYDITKVLNDSINGIFQKAGWSRVEQALTKSFHRLSEYKTKNIRKLKIFGDEIIYRDLQFYDAHTYDGLSIQWNSAKNETRLQFDDEFRYYLDCNMIGALNKTDAKISANPVFFKFAIIIAESSTGKKEEKIKIGIDYANIMHDDSTKLGGYYETKLKTRQKLMYEFHLMLPKVTRHCLARSKKFKQALKNSLLVYPKQNISLLYPDFSSNEQKYYYSIPKIVLQKYNLTYIRITGLSNFKSFRGTILHIVNISGTMYLDRDYSSRENIAMNFTIDNLFIDVNYLNKSVTVEAKNYTISQFDIEGSKNSASISSWLHEVSPIMIRHIESAIANSMMPSMENVVLMKSLDLSENYDITKALNESINDILQMAGWNRVENAFKKSLNRKLIYGEKIAYQSQEFQYVPKANFLSIHWTSPGNTTRIQCGETEYYLDGCMIIEPSPSKMSRYFNMHTVIQNLSIVTTESSIDRNNTTIKFDIDYNDIIDWERSKLPECGLLPFKKKRKILSDINRKLLKLMRDSLALDENFMDALGHSMLIYPKQKLIKVHPDFSHNEQKYYYLIPKICLEIGHLENVKIRGLANFESFDGTSLHVKNIDGFMTCIIHEAIIEFVTFEIDDLFVSFNRDNQSITVDARKYKIRQFEFRDSDSSCKHEALMLSWLHEFSPVLMRHVESAIANSIMPSMKKAN
ncbi:uncharacterized protein LOC135834905 isoform X2 [Planococcus citri]|uniref:uncharacterized protein LOC135834905 isoform X2 n=1 Tax=Planococcus citri TaxID=170843 RepID=UPI0031F74F32